MPLRPRLLRPQRKPPMTSSQVPRPLIFALPFFFVAIVSFFTPSPRRVNASGLVPLPEERFPHTCPSTRYAPVYIFLHLHKTAGNALKRALLAFATHNHFTMYHTCHPAVPDSFFVAWYLQRSKNLSASDCNLQLLPSLPLPNRSRISLVAGHQHHGVHTLFPNRPARYFTFMRHPIIRKTSHFLHFEPANASLSHYLLTRNSNYMTKRLATRAPTSQLALHFRARAIDVDPFARAAALSAAKSHLRQHYFFVGLHHRFHESLCVLSAILDRACATGHYGPAPIHQPVLAHNASFKTRRLVRDLHRLNRRSEALVRTLPTEIWNNVLKREAADLTLFEYAEQLFEDKLSQYPHCRASRSAGVAVAERHVDPSMEHLIS